MTKKICFIHTETTGLHELMNDKVYKKNKANKITNKIDEPIIKINVYEDHNLIKNNILKNVL